MSKKLPVGNPVVGKNETQAAEKMMTVKIAFFIQGRNLILFYCD